MLTFIVLAIGVLSVLISLPLLGLAALGYLGALADVGPAENRNLGIQLLSLGLPPLIGGVVLCVLGVLAFAWNRRRTAAEAGAAPNGGSATRLGNSGATEEPPSVRHYPLIVAAVLSIGVQISSAQGLKNVIPRNQEPILRALPPAPAEQSNKGTGKFIIFTREQVGSNWDFIAGAWECVPSRPATSLTKRIEFCHSSWNADALLDTSVRDDSRGMHPRFVRVPVDSGDRDYAVNLYDINYRTWEVRCLWQGKRLIAFGAMGDSVFCDSSDGWLRLNTASGTLSRRVPFSPIETDGNYWLVRKPGETEGCWSYDRVRNQFIAHFGPVDLPEMGFSPSRISPDGECRGWVLAAMPESWRGGVVKGRLILQRPSAKGDVSVPVEMQARMGSGVPVIPHDIELRFSPDGQLEFRARRGKDEAVDQVWSIDTASGKVSSRVDRHRPVAADELAVLDGVPVPDYLRNRVSGFRHFGRSGLAPAFLMHLGILKEAPEYPDCTAGVSRDGRHVLYAAKKGPFSGFYIYGDLLAKQTVRWKSPDGLDPRDSQEFVWVETPN
jgi:hypothetical protein